MINLYFDTTKQEKKKMTIRCKAFLCAVIYQAVMSLKLQHKTVLFTEIKLRTKMFLL